MGNRPPRPAGVSGASPRWRQPASEICNYARTKAKLTASYYRTLKVRDAISIVLPQDRFAVHLYRTKDGALRKVVLKPDGKLTSLCWSMGVAKVKSGSIPLIALKVDRWRNGRSGFECIECKSLGEDCEKQVTVFTRVLNDSLHLSEVLPPCFVKAYLTFPYFHAGRVATQDTLSMTFQPSPCRRVLRPCRTEARLSPFKEMLAESSYLWRPTMFFTRSW